MVFVGLIVPLPYKIKRKLFTFISESPIIAKIQYGMKVREPTSFGCMDRIDQRLSRLRSSSFSYCSSIASIVSTVFRLSFPHIPRMEVVQGEQRHSFSFIVVSTSRPGIRISLILPNVEVAGPLHSDPNEWRSKLENSILNVTCIFAVSLSFCPSSSTRPMS